MTANKKFERVIILIVLVVFYLFVNYATTVRIEDIESDNRILKYNMDSLIQRNDSLELRLDSLQDQLDGIILALNGELIFYGITATMYYPVEEQCDDTPDITAGGFKIDISNASEHRWIAVSHDLKRYLKFGDMVYLVSDNINGRYMVADLMSERWTQKIDILETEGTPLYAYNNVKIIKI